MSIAGTNINTLSTGHIKVYLVLALTLLIYTGIPAERTHADIIYQQPIRTINDGGSDASPLTWIPVATSTNPTGMGFDGYLATVTLWLAGNSTNGTYDLTVRSYTNQALSAGNTVVCTASSDRQASTGGITGSGEAHIFGCDYVELNPAFFYTFSLTCSGCGSPTNSYWRAFGTLVAPGMASLGTRVWNPTDGLPYMYLNSSTQSPTETRIIGVIPLDNSTYDVGQVDIFMDTFVSDEDACGWYKCVYASLTLTYQENPFDPVVTLLEDEQYDSGTYSFSYPETLEAGVYQLRGRLQYKYFGTLSGAIIDQEFATFLVGTSTLLSQAYMNVVGDTYSYISTADATTTAAFAQTCNPLGGTFDMLSCIVFLALPNPQRTASYIQAVSDEASTAFPFGYVTLIRLQLFSVSSSTASASILPTLDIEIPSGFPGAGSSFNLTPWDNLLGDTSILATAEAAGDNPQTLREVVEPGWRKLVYLSFILILLFELIGMGSYIGGHNLAESQLEPKRRAFYQALREGRRK